MSTKLPLRLLIACPCYPQGQGVFSQTQAAIQELAQSSQSEVVYLKRPLGTESAYANITANYEEARTIALDRGVDALMCVEADIVPPANAVEQLDCAGADVTYGLYVWRGQRLWSAYSTVGENQGVSLSADPARARAEWGRVIDVQGVGLGCTLIRRHVLEAVTFRLPSEDPEGICCAWMFAVDCNRLRFSQRAHLGVVCGHVLHSSSAGVLWPDPTAANLYRLDQ